MRSLWLAITLVSLLPMLPEGSLPGSLPGAWPRVSIGRAHAQTLDPARTYQIPVDHQDPVRGPAQALVTIVEFSDFECPYCGRVQETLAELNRLYPGQLRLVFRHNPLDLEDGTLAAEASAAAAAQGWFWPMHDRLFATRGRITRDQLEDFALELGLDMARFRHDLYQRRFLPQVQADADVVRGMGVRSTPVFFINGRPVMGAQPLDVFARVVEEELARARAMVMRGIEPARVYETLMRAASASAASAASVSGAAGRPEGAPAADSEDAGAFRAPDKLDPTRLYRVGPGLPGHHAGPADALLTVVVFTDFECPFCARLQPTLEALRAAYPADVRVVLRHMPLSFHSRAQLVAEAAVAAAAQGALWAFHDRVFAEPEALTRKDLERHAQAIGLDMAAFRAALDDRRYLEAVAADAAAGKALGVRGTPTVFINGTPMVGVAPFPYMQQVFIEPKLAEARALVAGGVPRAQVYEVLLRMAGNDATRTR